MGWEERRGQLYYYRKVRRGGQVVSEYVGGGEAAALFSRLDRLEKQQAQEEREEQRREREALAAKEEAFAAYFDSVEAILRQTLEAAGFHKPKRGQWRKRRHEKDTEQSASNDG